MNSVLGKTEYIALESSEWPNMLTIPLPISLASSKLGEAQRTYPAIPSESFSSRPKPTEKSQEIRPAAGDALWKQSASLSEHHDMQGACSPLHSKSHFCSANLRPTEEQHRLSREVNLPLLLGRMTVY